MSAINIAQYNKSFSGNDTVAFIILPGCVPVCIGSVTTVSYSVYRNKKPVINLGRTNINGVTRGSRIYAGTMIFTLINQHWVRELISQDTCKSWLGDVEEIKADELPLFDIMVVSANEYGAYCSMFIYGIDLTDEAQTLSIEDLFTENVFQFVARDLSVFKSGDATDLTVKSSKQKYKNTNSKISNSRLLVLNNSGTTDSDLNRYIRDRLETEVALKENASRYKVTLARTLYESTSKTFMGNDVISVQTLLNQNGYDVNINGIYDHDTAEAVRQYQTAYNINPNGVVDVRLYNSLISTASNNSSNLKSLNGCVVNKSGAKEYRYPDLESDIIDIYPYKSNVSINNSILTDSNIEFYITENGYILSNDIFNTIKSHSITEIPVLNYNDSNLYVTLIKECINTIYPTAHLSDDSIYDQKTLSYVKKIQKENSRPVTGTVDNDTWLLIQNLANNINNTNIQDNTSFVFNVLPSTVNLKLSELNNFLDSLTTNINTNNLLNVKLTATSFKNSNSYKTKDKLITVNNSSIIDFKSFKDNFIYDAQTGSIPDKVELVLYPYNLLPYKWIVNIER